MDNASNYLVRCVIQKRIKYSIRRRKIYNYYFSVTNDEGICDQDGVYSQTVNFDNHPAFHPDFGTEPLGPFSINCYDRRIVMQHFSESISKDAINSFDVLVEDYHKGINGK